jgi:hypothetical protein
LLSNEEWFLASFYIPSKLTNLTPDIADRIYAAYRSDLAIRMSLMMRLLDGKPVGVSKMKSQVDFSTSLMSQTLTFTLQYIELFGFC